jgi:hypothetical protein
MIRFEIALSGKKLARGRPIKVFRVELGSLNCRNSRRHASAIAGVYIEIHS